jgi:hypothetical protein
LVSASVKRLNAFSINKSAIKLGSINKYGL